VEQRWRRVVHPDGRGWASKLIKLVVKGGDIAATFADVVATDGNLRDAIGQLYRKGASVGSGSAMDAYRYELRTGTLLSPSGHLPKLKERRTQLQNILKKDGLSDSDRSIINGLLSDIGSAIKGG
jgi:hypothetical protein